MVQFINLILSVILTLSIYPNSIQQPQPQLPPNPTPTAFLTFHNFISNPDPNSPWPWFQPQTQLFLTLIPSHLKKTQKAFSSTTSANLCRETSLSNGHWREFLGHGWRVISPCGVPLAFWGIKLSQSLLQEYHQNIQQAWKVQDQQNTFRILQFLFCNLNFYKFFVNFLGFRYDVVVVMFNGRTSLTSDVFPLHIQKPVKLNRLLYQPSVLLHHAVVLTCRVTDGTDINFQWTFGDGSSRPGNATEHHTFHRWLDLLQFWNM